MGVETDASVLSLWLPLWWILVSILAPLAVLLVHFHPTLTYSESIFLSIPLGFTVFSWITYFSGIMFGLTRDTILTICLTTSTLLITYIIHHMIIFHKHKINIINRGIYNVNFHTKILYLVLISFGFLFGFLLYTHVIWEKMGSGNNVGYHSVFATWSDLPFHLDVIKSFVYGENKFQQNWLPKSPIFAGELLSYPFLPDYQAAVMIVAGASTRLGIILPSWLLAISFIALLYTFSLRFTQSAVQSFMAVVITVCSGGIGAVSFFYYGEFGWDDLRDSVQWYYWGGDQQRELYWFSLVGHILLPQRSSIFAYPICLGIFSCFLVAEQKSTYYVTSRKLYLLCGFMTALLPILQAHAYIGVGIIAICLALVGLYNRVLGCSISIRIVERLSRLIKKNKESDTEKESSFMSFTFKPDLVNHDYFLNWFLFGVPALSLAFPQIYYFLQRVKGKNDFIFYSPLWTRWKTTPWSLWFEALGFFVFLSLLGIETLSWKKTKFYLGFIAIFVVSNVIIFQPWDKDNLKLFYFWVFCASGAIAKVIYKMVTSGWISIIKRQKKGKRHAPKALAVTMTAVGVFIFITLILSGGLVVVRETIGESWEMWNQEDVEFAEWVVENTPRDAVIVTSNSHIQVVSAIAGRTKLMGWSSWCDSHGYPYKQRHTHRYHIFAAPSPKAVAELVAQYNITYALIDPTLKHEFGDKINYQFWQENVEAVFETNKYQLYDVKSFAKRFFNGEI